MLHVLSLGLQVYIIYRSIIIYIYIYIYRERATLGPQICKYDLTWATWSLRVYITIRGALSR